MNALQTLDAFLRTAQLKSFTRAAESLGLSRATVSRLVTTLENEVGQQLLFRTTRRVELTEAGKDFVLRAEKLSEAAEALFARTTADTPLTGCLRIASSPGLATFILGEAVERFARRHPLLSLELRSAPESVDLVATATDLDFRVGVTDERLQPLGVCRSVLCAAPGYLKEAGVPKTPEELCSRSLVVQPYPSVWTFAAADGSTRRIPAVGRLKFSDVGLALAAVCRGCGIGLLPDIAVMPRIDAGELQPLLPQWQTPAAVIGVRTAPSRIVNRAAAAFKAFVKSQLGNGSVQQPNGGGRDDGIPNRFARENPKK